MKLAPKKKGRRTVALPPSPAPWLEAAYVRALDRQIERLGWVTAAELRAIGPAWRRLLAYVQAHPERYASAMRRVEGRWRVTYQMRDSKTPGPA